MRYFRLLILPLIFLFAACDPLAGGGTNPPPPPAEDDPAFDCLRNGNHICGPVHVDDYGDHICADSALNGAIGCYYTDFFRTPNSAHPALDPGYICRMPLFCTNHITYHYPTQVCSYTTGGKVVTWLQATRTGDDPCINPG